MNSPQIPRALPQRSTLPPWTWEFTVQYPQTWNLTAQGLSPRPRGPRYTETLRLGLTPPPNMGPPYCTGTLLQMLTSDGY